MPTVLIIAGPNGAGKTTLANVLLADRAEPFEFVNADEIARRIGGRGEWRSADLLAGVDQSLQRVRRRVQMGGHDIPEVDIRRRFPKSLEYLDGVYKPIVDAWQIWRSGEAGLQLLEFGP